MVFCLFVFYDRSIVSHLTEETITIFFQNDTLIILMWWCSSEKYKSIRTAEALKNRNTQYFKGGLDARYDNAHTRSGGTMSLNSSQRVS